MTIGMRMVNGRVVASDPPLWVETKKGDVIVPKIKSSGGSTEYYKIDIPLEFIRIDAEAGVATVEVRHLIRYGLGDSFPLGNCLKALFRIGKKEGIDEEYDRNKIIWSINDYVDSRKQPR